MSEISENRERLTEAETIFTDVDYEAAALPLASSLPGELKTAIKVSNVQLGGLQSEFTDCLGAVAGVVSRAAEGRDKLLEVLGDINDDQGQTPTTKAIIASRAMGSHMESYADMVEPMRNTLGKARMYLEMATQELERYQEQHSEARKHVFTSLTARNILLDKIDEVRDTL